MRGVVCVCVCYYRIVKQFEGKRRKTDLSIGHHTGISQRYLHRALSQPQHLSLLVTEDLVAGATLRLTSMMMTPRSCCSPDWWDVQFKRHDDSEGREGKQKQRITTTTTTIPSSYHVGHYMTTRRTDRLYNNTCIRTGKQATLCPFCSLAFVGKTPPYYCPHMLLLILSYHPCVVLYRSTFLYDSIMTFILNRMD